ncbi:hypothetical protein OKW30_002492 [Paraburkholderia sp. Clong3]
MGTASGQRIREAYFLCEYYRAESIVTNLHFGAEGHGRLETSGNTASCHRSMPASNTWHNAPHSPSPDQYRIVGLMLSCFCRKLGSYLGLLAILMATLAPTVSQALADRNEAGLPSASLCSAHSTPGNPPGNEDTSHSLAAHWHACGYCNLIAHMPVLPSVQPEFAVTVWAIQHRVATRFESIRRVEPLASAQPRAPPISS